MSRQFDDDIPIYQQIADRIRKAILSGDIREGEAIPSVRQMSVKYNLNPQTVLNATQLLLNDNLIEKRRGLGMFVKSDARNTLMNSEEEKFRTQNVTDFVYQAKLLGFTEQEFIDLIRKKYKEV